MKYYQQRKVEERMPVWWLCRSKVTNRKTHSIHIASTNQIRGNIKYTLVNWHKKADAIVNRIALLQKITTFFYSFHVLSRESSSHEAQAKRADQHHHQDTEQKHGNHPAEPGRHPVILPLRARVVPAHVFPVTTAMSTAPGRNPRAQRQLYWKLATWYHSGTLLTVSGIKSSIFSCKKVELIITQPYVEGKLTSRRWKARSTVDLPLWDIFCVVSRLQPLLPRVLAHAQTAYISCAICTVPTRVSL